MLPLILGAAALAGGAASAYSNSKKNDATQNAYGKVGSVAQAGHDREMGIAGDYDWRDRMSAANDLRQDANAYEINQAIQGGLSAYGGSPLSGSAKNAVYDRLQQQARGNYQTSLANANSMLGADMQARLGIEGNLTQNLMDVQKAKANAAAAEKSGFDSFLDGAGKTLSVASKIKGMG
ncbi:MAG: hypothetical protein FWF63_00480 [Fibromonadales bacterium]|nr:hypothetical protein [Fibromonadales bacterium]